MRVLIVDDENLIATSLRVFLEDEGFEADTAGSSEEALEMLGGGARFDVCVMDMRLPGMDGNAAIKSIRHLYPGMKFIVHTGSINYSVPEELRQIGIRDRYLFRKPMTDMRPIVDAILSLGRADQEPR